jgi:hypothetical protein
MSEIVFRDGHRYLFQIDTIEFWAHADGREICCKITLEEMMRDFAGAVDSQTLEDEFVRHRPQIEERARRIIRERQSAKMG